MARIKTTSSSAAFDKMHEVSRSMDERNDCTVKSLALACGLSYEVAHRILKAKGRKAGRGVNRRHLEAAIKEQGYNLTHVSGCKFIERYPKAHQTLKSVTAHHPERFNKIWADGHTYLMYTSSYSHVLVVRDGKNLDWTKGSAKRIVNILHIEKRS